MVGWGTARVLLDAELLASLGLAKPLMFAESCVKLDPPALGLGLFGHGAEDLKA